MAGTAVLQCLKRLNRTRGTHSHELTAELSSAEGAALGGKQLFFSVKLLSDSLVGAGGEVDVRVKFAFKK